MDLMFDEYEDELQKNFEDIEIPFEKAKVLTVTLMRFRNISVGNIRDIIDTPDPQFRISCPKLNDSTLKKFKTRTIPPNTTKAEIFEKFSFVLPDDLDDEEEFPLVISLYDEDILFDDKIGNRVIDLSKLNFRSRVIYRSLTFGEEGKNGTLDLKMKMETRYVPDFRLCLSLSPAERDFRKKRIPFACAAMKNLFENGHCPTNALETPIVSLVGSGGGYRAVVGMCGAMEALEEEGLLDIITYTCGLSGSAWYLSAAYGLQGFSRQKEFHDGIRKRFSENLWLDFANPITIDEFRNHKSETLAKFDLPCTFVNYFPGFVVGRQLLGEENMEIKLSDQASYVEEGKVPYPVLVALHVKNNISAHRFHAYVERSPDEIYLPDYGIGISPEKEGSYWSDGFLVRSCPEYPLHFTLGMIGCCFCILLNHYLRYGDETGTFFMKKIEKIRTFGRKNAKRTLEETGRIVNIESDDDSDDSDDESTDSSCSDESEKSSLSSSEDLNCTTVDEAPASSESLLKNMAITFIDILEKIKGNTFFTHGGEGYLGRTARIKNFVLNFDTYKRFNLNPQVDTVKLDKHQKELVKKAGHKCCKHDMAFSCKRKALSFADAGILKNVPTDAVLRPQRGTDLLLVMDFTAYDSDEEFNYKPLILAAAHAYQSGLKFPKIDLKKIKDLPPKELLFLPSDDDDCPSVLWFTLCNKKFKESYCGAKSTATPSDPDQPFNDFPVFGKGSFCSTFRFQYDNYNFDQLKELMKFNVKSHAKEIKRELIKATERKRRRLRSPKT